MKTTKHKAPISKCTECGGIGIRKTKMFTTVLSDPENEGETACEKCHGIGIIGITLNSRKRDFKIKVVRVIRDAILNDKVWSKTLGHELKIVPSKRGRGWVPELRFTDDFLLYESEEAFSSNKVASVYMTAFVKTFGDITSAKWKDKKGQCDLAKAKGTYNAILIANKFLNL